MALQPDARTNQELRNNFVVCLPFTHVQPIPWTSGHYLLRSLESSHFSPSPALSPVQTNTVPPGPLQEHLTWLPCSFSTRMILLKCPSDHIEESEGRQAGTRRFGLGDHRSNESPLPSSNLHSGKSPPPADSLCPIGQYQSTCTTFSFHSTLCSL